MTLKVKRLLPVVALPSRANLDAAGYDLPMRTVFNGTEYRFVVIYPGKTRLFSTGYAIEIPMGWCGIVSPRGSATKAGLVIQGLVDSDYRGELFIPVLNVSDHAIDIERGKIIAQLTLVQHAKFDVEVVEELSPSTRGDGAFGSTGNSVGS